MKMPETYNAVVSRLRDATDFYLRTGIAFLPSTVELGADVHSNEFNWKECCKLYRAELSIIRPHFVRGYLRRLSKEIKRPLIIAEENSWYRAQGRQSICVTIPKRKYLYGVNMILTLTAKPVSDKDNELQSCYDQTNMYYHFKGPKGRKLFEDFVENLIKEPVYRKAMKLPPLTQ